MNFYFWTFPSHIFGWQLTQVTETMESETADKGGITAYTYITTLYVYLLVIS